MKNLSPLDYAKMCADSVMEQYTPETLPPENHFHYHQGVFLSGVEKIYDLSKEEKYRSYIMQWVDRHVKEDGTCPTAELTSLDDIQPGILLFALFETTGYRKYKKLLDIFFDTLEKWPTNNYGGVWHKYRNPDQLWLDTMYMFGLFTAMYCSKFNKPYMFGKIATQVKLIRERMYNPETGLLYHMWDDSKRHEFVDKATGLAKVHWGRATSWYIVSLAEFTTYAPKDSELYKLSVDIGRELLATLAKYQDKETGMWYQVLDKINDNRNWLETSCTALFTYAAAKLYNNGIAGDEYKDLIMNGYKGALSKAEISGSTLSVTNVCVGTGVGVEDYYFYRPTISNDLHGAGAFIMMCTEVEKFLNNIN
ncbi:MAG: glycoside hydrolase family 88 protein [Clostridia bacterium]|nr:glycoside hydrolase family 88 protein [Clostridia bacterium]